MRARRPARRRSRSRRLLSGRAPARPTLGEWLLGGVGLLLRGMARVAVGRGHRRS